MNTPNPATSSKSKIVILARHAESSGNVDGIIMATGNYALTKRGMEQAMALRHALLRYPIDVVFSSPVNRAVQTAKIATDAPIITIPALTEMDMGEFVGKPASELSTLYPSLTETWWEAPENFRAPGGESLSEVHDRVWGAWQEIDRAHQGTILIISHRYALRILLCKLTHIPLRAFRIFDCPPCGYTVLNGCLGSYEISEFNAHPSYALNQPFIQPHQEEKI